MRRDGPDGPLLPAREVGPRGRSQRRSRGIPSHRATADHDIQTSGLPAGAYTVWWVIFDTPSGCSGSCGEDDLFNRDANVSVFWATGRVVPRSGVVGFRARHRAGESLGEPGTQHILGDGSLDPSRAEIHNVIKYHGPASDDPDTLASQIYTLQGGCLQGANAVDLGDPFGVQCFDPQAVVHPLP